MARLLRDLAGASLLAVLVVCSGGLASTANDPKKVGYGKHLASECTSCHRIDGVDNGIPSITGWETAEFVQTMGWYKDGARINPAMKSVAESLDDEQVEALATFFASLPKPPKKQ